MKGSERALVSIDCRIGFVNKGVNEPKHGSVTWYDCIYEVDK